MCWQHEVLEWKILQLWSNAGWTCSVYWCSGVLLFPILNGTISCPLSLTPHHNPRVDLCVKHFLFLFLFKKNNFPLWNWLNSCLRTPLALLIWTLSQNLLCFSLCYARFLNSWTYLGPVFCLIWSFFATLAISGSVRNSNWWIVDADLNLYCVHEHHVSLK